MRKCEVIFAQALSLPLEAITYWCHNYALAIPAIFQYSMMGLGSDTLLDEKAGILEIPNVLLYKEQATQRP